MRPDEKEIEKMKTGTHIRAKRAARRCSQLRLAKLSGLSRYVLSLIENGYRKPTKAELRKIKTALSAHKDSNGTGGRP